MFISARLGALFCSPRGLGKDVFLHAQKIFAVLPAGASLGTRAAKSIHKVYSMSRKKLPNSEDLLSHNIIIRVSENLFKKLDKIRKESRSPSIAEVCRKLLNNQKIKLYQEDVTMNPTMEQLAMIRKELKAIGININQVTRSFNGAKEENNRSYYALQVADLYKHVDAKVDHLLAIVAKLAEKWLQK
jgi:hypothetical protein